MGDKMIDWSQTQLLTWIRSIPTSKLSDTVKNQIIAGINKYAKDNDMPVPGKDFTEADKGDLKGMCGIDGNKANKLLQIIHDRLDDEFEDQNNKYGNEGSRTTNDTSNDSFTLNIVGSSVKPIKLKNIRKTMLVSAVKALYLTEFGNETAAHKYANKKWGTDKKGQITFKYNCHTLLDNKPLSDYDCNDGLLPVLAVFRVQGGMDGLADKFTNDRFAVGDRGLATDTRYAGDQKYKVEVVRVKTDKILVKWTDYSNVSNVWIPKHEWDARLTFPKKVSTSVSKVKDCVSTADKASIDQTKSDTTVQDSTANEPNESDTITSQNPTEKSNETIANMKKMGLEIGDQIEVLALPQYKWVHGTIASVYLNVITIHHDKTAFQNDKSVVYYNDLGKRVRKFVKVKDYTQKPMCEWSKSDVTRWVESIPAFKKYAESIGKTMNGKELLDTTKDDLALIISSGLQRRKFIEKLDIAKETYKSTHASDEQKSENVQVNGVVLLNNMGNTCYMNTSIQLLSQTPYLTRYLKKRAKSHDFITAKEDGNVLWKCVTSLSTKPYQKNRKQNGINDRHMLNAWTDLCDTIYNQPRNGNRFPVQKPKGIRNALHQIDEDFGSGDQDDSVRSLTIMLQALDSEIESEMNQNKSGKNGKGSVGHKYMDKYQLKHGKILSKSDEDKVIETLLSKHNPNKSIVRKTFDGVERFIYECLHCNEILQQYVIFRDLDLPVISHGVTFTNIYIVFRNKLCYLPTCTLLDYCSMDVLKYEVIQKLKLDSEFDVRDINIITLSNGGKVKHFTRQNKISELQQSNDNIFVLINETHSNHYSQSRAKLLQFTIAIDERGDPSMSEYKCVESEQDSICDLITREIEEMSQKTDYNYIVHYNGHILSDKSEMEKADFASIHNQQSDINVLFLLCVDSKNNDFDLDIKNIDTVLFAEATQKYRNHSYFDAMRKFEKWKQSKNKSNVNVNCYGMPQLRRKLQNDMNLELNRIRKTVKELEKRTRINTFVSEWINTNFKSNSSKLTELTDITECLNEYQKTRIVDNTVFEYKCVHCHKECRWIKICKQIVSTPPVLILHLDRFGKDSTGNRLEKKSYPSNGRYSAYEFTSNKFDHKIQYKEMLSLSSNGKNGKEYGLFGISNHSGTTKGGHYTATIRCLTDTKWYSISDSNGSQTRNVTGNQKSATILMYSLNITDQK